MIKYFTLSELEFKFFKGLNLPEIKSENPDYIIPSGAVFPSALKVDKFKKVGFKNTEKVLVDGDILFNTGGVGTLGRSGFFDSSLLPKAQYSSDSFVLVLRNINKNIFSKYIFYAFQTPQVKLQIQQKTVGTTGITSIKPIDILNIEIPIPINQSGGIDFTEQARVVSILDEIQGLKDKRQLINRKMAGLAPALFVKMFGNPARPSKDVKTKILGDLADVHTGGTPSRKNKQLYNGSIPWVKTTEVKDKIIYHTHETITEEGLNVSNCQVFPIDSIIIAMYGQGKTRGRTGVLGIKAATNQACAVLMPSEKYNTKFLWTQLRLSYDKFRSLSRGGNQPNLNLSLIKNFEVIAPSLELQNQFAKLLGEIETQEELQSQELTELDELFNSVLYKSFTGELTPFNKKVALKSAVPQWTFKDWFNLKQGVAAILERWSRGEMVVEKLLYFLQKIKMVNFKLAFARHNFGPYDPKVKSVLYAPDKYFEQKTQNGYKVFTISNLGQQKLLKYDGVLLKQSRAAVIDLARDITGLTSPQIEIIATICKLIEDLKTTEILQIQNELATWKDKNVRFTPQQVKEALTFILSKNWHLKLLE